MVYVMWSVCVDHEASMPNRFVRLGKGCVKFCKDWVNIRITNIKKAGLLRLLFNGGCPLIRLHTLENNRDTLTATDTHGG